MAELSPFGDVPPELQAQYAAQARKQALAQLLMQRSLGGVQLPQQGRMASPVSPLAALAPIVDAYVGAKTQGDTTADQLSLGQKYQNMSRQAMMDYIAKSRGEPGTPPTPATGPTDFSSPSAGTPGALPTSPDPIGASTQAMGSPFPHMREVGKIGLTEALKNQLSQKDLLSLDGYDPQTKVVGAQMLAAGMPIGQVISSLGPKKDIRVDQGTVVDVTGGQPKSLGYYGAEWEKNPDGTPKITQVIGADGKPEPYQRNLHSGELKKLDNAPKVNISAQITNAGPKAGAEKIFEEGAKTVSELGKSARQSQAMMESVQRMQALDQQGIFSNVTTGPATFVTNLAQAAGVPISKEDAAKLGNTETFTSVSNEALQRLISQMGGNRNVTKEEVEYLIKTIVPQAKSSPQARQQIYQFLTNVAQRETARFHKANEHFTAAVTQGKPELWQSEFANVFAPIADAPEVRPSLRMESPDATPLPPPKPQGQLKPYR